MHCQSSGRPQQVEHKKRRLEETEIKKKKLKLLEKAQADSRQPIAATRQLNNIQEHLVKNEEEQAELEVILQDPMACPDDDVRKYL